MPVFKISQGEVWARNYVIQASTPEDAKKLYKQYLLDRNESLILRVDDPMYVEDILDDIIVYDSEGIEQ